MGGVDITAPRSSFVHAVGALARRLPQDGGDAHVAGLVAALERARSTATPRRSPSRTRLGVEIALGTDWTPSGSMNLLRELACADSLNKGYFAGYFTDEELWLMVTRNAAASVNYDDVLGRLAPGAFGDIAIFDGSTKKDHRAVIEGAPETVGAGRARGQGALRRRGRGQRARLGLRRRSTSAARSKAVCATSETGKTFAALQTANASSYALVLLQRRAARRADLHAQAPDRGQRLVRSTPAPPPPTTWTATASPTPATTARRCSTPSAPSTTASRPTPTATASATRATPARSTPRR